MAIVSPGLRLPSADSTTYRETGALSEGALASLSPLDSSFCASLYCCRHNIKCHRLEKSVGLFGVVAGNRGAMGTLHSAPWLV